MATALKDQYNMRSLQTLAMDISTIYNEFQSDAFLQSTMDETWADLELKARIT